MVASYGDLQCLILTLTALRNLIPSATRPPASFLLRQGQHGSMVSQRRQLTVGQQRLMLRAPTEKTTVVLTHSGIPQPHSACEQREVGACCVNRLTRMAATRSHRACSRDCEQQSACDWSLCTQASRSSPHCAERESTNRVFKSSIRERSQAIGITLDQRV